MKPKIYICNRCGAGSVSRVCIECGSSDTRVADDRQKQHQHEERDRGWRLFTNNDHKKHEDK